jgi:hypothetical protein
MIMKFRAQGIQGDDAFSSPFAGSPTRRSARTHETYGARSVGNIDGTIGIKSLGRAGHLINSHNS